jgi:hypothetical protein
MADSETLHDWAERIRITREITRYHGRDFRDSLCEGDSICLMAGTDEYETCPSEKALDVEEAANRLLLAVDQLPSEVMRSCPISVMGPINEYRKACREWLKLLDERP